MKASSLLLSFALAFATEDTGSLLQKHSNAKILERGGAAANEYEDDNADGKKGEDDDNGDGKKGEDDDTGDGKKGEDDDNGDGKKGEDDDTGDDDDSAPSVVQLLPLGHESVTSDGDNFYLGSLFVDDLVTYENASGFYQRAVAGFGKGTGVDYSDSKLYGCGSFTVDGQTNLNVLDLAAGSVSSVNLLTNSGYNFGEGAFLANDLTVDNGTVYVTVATGSFFGDGSSQRGLVVKVEGGEPSVLVSSDTNPSLVPKPFNLDGTEYYFGPSGIDSIDETTLLMGAANRGDVSGGPPDPCLYTVSKDDGTTTAVNLSADPLWFPSANNSKLSVGIDGLVVLPSGSAAVAVVYQFDTATYQVDVSVKKLETTDAWVSAKVVGMFANPQPNCVSAANSSVTAAGALSFASVTFKDKADSSDLDDVQVWALAADIAGKCAGGGLLVPVSFA